MKTAVKLLGLEYANDEEDGWVWVLRFTTSRVIQVPHAMMQAILFDARAPEGVVRDEVKRRAFEIYDHPVRYHARIVSCAELWDADRRTPPDPFSPPRSWEAPSDGDESRGATR